MRTPSDTTELPFGHVNADDGQHNHKRAALDHHAAHRGTQAAGKPVPSTGSDPHRTSKERRSLWLPIAISAN
jgi:hypothetical protein